MSSPSSSNSTGDHQKQKSQQQQPHQTQRTIPISSARRRLADGLLQEEMEIDPTLCVTTPTTIREFLSVLLDFGAVGNNDRRDSSSSKNVKQEQNNNSSSSPSSSTSLQEFKQLKNEIQNQNNNNNSNSQKHFSSSSGNNEGRGVLSDDSSNFSKKCDEARVRSVVRSRQIFDETINRRKQQQEQFRKEHEMQRNIQLSNKNNHNEDAPIEGLTHYHHHHQSQTTPENVLTLAEWKSIVRQHPALLKFSLDRAMSRSETTATAMISDLPVAILPAREKVLSATSSSSSTKRTSATSISNNKTTSSADGDSDSDDENNSSLSTSQSDVEKQRKLNSSSRDNNDDENEEEKSYSSKISSLTQSGWSFASDYWQKGYQWLERFISGGIAGGVAKSVIAPGDRVKIIFQVNAELAFSIFAALNLGKEIVQRNGVFGLWAGHGATLLRVVPYASISFASFEFYNLSLRGHILNVHELETEIRNSGGRASKSEQKKLDELLLQKNGNSKENSGTSDDEDSDKNNHDQKTSSSKRQIALRFICGALAGATATSATYPLDLLRARYAAHSLHSSGRPYASYFIGLNTIYQGEGLKALYSGLGPTLLGIVPYAGASFTVFETLKAFVLSRNAKLVREQQEIMRRNDENNNNEKDKKNNNNNKNSKNSLPADEKEKSHELATWQRLSAGALSGLIAQSLTYPLDIVRRRMQVMPAQSKTMRETLKLIYKNEGFRGLYKGLTMNWVKGPIAVAVSFTINDWLKTRQQRFHAQTALLSAANGTDDDHDNVDSDENIASISDNKEITNSNNKENLDAEGKSTLKTQKGDENNQQLTIMHTSRRKKNKKGNAQEEAYVNCDQDLKAIQMNEFLTEDEKKYAIQQKQIELHTSLSERFVIGALAGASAKIWTVPFDRLKLMMALGRVTNDGISPGHQFRTVLDLVLQTRNPFQGAAGQLLRVMPFAAVSYTMFDLCQPFSRRIVLTKDASFASDMIAGASAAAVATVVAHPLDLVRSKFALAEKGGAPLPFSSYSEGIKILLNETKTNGFSSTLFHGLRPALAGVCPLAAFSFAIYHEGKRRGWAQEGDSFASRMMLGAGAGIIGQVASYPLNLVRRRAIAMAEEEVSESIANQLRAGLRGDSYTTFHNMYRRMPLGWSLGTMTLALSFAANDWMRDKLVEVRRKHATELLMRDPTM